MLYEFLTPVKLSILITLVYSLAKLTFSNNVHRIVITIVSVDFLTEFINSLFIAVLHLPYKKVALINVIVQHCLWLFLLGVVIQKKKAMLYFILFFFGFAVINFRWGQGPDKFNYYTFVLGAFLYLAFFFLESFSRLQNEHFEFIFSNNYLLLCAPIMFLFGMSLMFAFVSRDITQTKVFFSMTLYKIVSDYVNLVCYSIICIYIYKELKVKNG